ncbi:MAG: L,D-transpeptidase family protein, partial [Burkholderiales bacterium]|nr:L,D-transpeptidase family protein [Burkholderiales bacterium]
LPSDLGTQYIMVNIPSFSLKVIANDQTVLDMPVIVGSERGLHSCVLSSQITYLDINPYWYIPNSIALRDMLPKLKHNPSYLIENHIKMYTSYGLDGKEVNSKDISWNKVESNIFPYKLRQEPGADNSLGRVKFIFPNDCGIYLHDTSTPQLFQNSKRDLSHGCIRIGKPIELAAYLLQDKSGWDQEKIVSTIASNTSKIVMLNKPMNIHIIYATAWVNESGVLQFRKDIYGMDAIPYPVYLPPSSTLSIKPTR